MQKLNFKNSFFIFYFFVFAFHFCFSFGESYNLQLPEGINFIAISVEPFNSEPLSGLGITNSQIFRLQGNKYVFGEEVAKLRAGNGYWLFLPEEEEITIEGEEVKTSSYGINLEPGWNQIGNPFLSNILLDTDNVCVSKKGQNYYKSLTLSEDLLKVPIYKYNRNNGTYYQFVPSEYTNLNPWEGFWIKAKEGCNLLIFKDDTLNIYIADSTGKNGEEILIPVKIGTTKASFQTFKFEVSVNESVLDFRGVEKTEIVKDFMVQVGGNNKIVIFYVMNQAQSLPCNIEGEIAKLKFFVRGSVGMESEVKIQNIEFLTPDYKKITPLSISSTFKVIE